MADADRVQVNINGDWDDILTDEVKGYNRISAR